MIQRWGGPYYIVLANNNHTYCLRDCKENNLHTGLVHARCLKAYNDPNSRPTNNPLDLQETVTQDAVPNQQDLSQPDPTPAQNFQDPENTPNASGPVNSHTPDSVSQEEFALVEILLKCAMIRNKRHYLVKWANKDFKNSWEPQENISDVLIHDFYTKCTLSGHRRKWGPINHKFEFQFPVSKK